MKEISVIIPTYNFVEVTKKVIEATLTQSFPPKEIIVVDSSESNAIENMIGNIDSNDIPIIYKRVNSFPVRQEMLALDSQHSSGLLFWIQRLYLKSIG